MFRCIVFVSPVNTDIIFPDTGTHILLQALIAISALFKDNGPAPALFQRFQPVSQCIIIFCIFRVFVRLKIIFLFWF